MVATARRFGRRAAHRVAPPSDDGWSSARAAGDRPASACRGSRRRRRDAGARRPPPGIRAQPAEPREHRDARRRRCVASGTVGPDAMTLGSSPTTSEIASVRHQRRAAAARLAAFDRRQVLADGIERVDVGAGAQQPRRRLPFVIERTPAAGHGHQRRRAARQQHEQSIARRDRCRASVRAPARPALAARPGLRMFAGDRLERRRSPRPRRSDHRPAANALAEQRAAAAAIAGAAFPAAMIHTWRSCRLARQRSGHERPAARRHQPQR